MSELRLRLDCQLSSTHPCLAGHFPGSPIFPGVVLVAQVLEAVLQRPALAARLGARPQIANVKFLSAVEPATQGNVNLVIELTEKPQGLDFELLDGEVVAVKGQLRAGAAA